MFTQNNNRNCETHVLILNAQTLFQLWMFGKFNLNFLRNHLKWLSCMFQLAPHKCTNKYQLGQIKWSIYLGITNRYTINHDIVCAVCVCVLCFSFWNVKQLKFAISESSPIRTKSINFYQQLYGFVFYKSLIGNKTNQQLRKQQNTHTHTQTRASHCYWLQIKSMNLNVFFGLSGSCCALILNIAALNN